MSDGPGAGGMMEKACASCGGTVVARAGPGRTTHVRGALCAVPDDLVIRTCTNCGAEWMNRAEILELEERVGPAESPGSIWAVFRYVPDVAAGERVNVAAVAVSRATPVVAHFHMTDATLARMTMIDPRPPLDAVVSLLGSVRDDIVRGTFDERSLRLLAGEWNNTVQLSRPGPSTLTPEATIALLVPLLFPERASGACAEKGASPP